MSEPTLSQLLDRAVHHAPPMDLSSEQLLSAGRSRVRRRRAAGAGGLLGGAALVAAVWAGLGGDGSPLSTTPDLQPATTVLDRGVPVDAPLFEAYRTIDSEQVAHSFSGRLTRGETGPLVLEVSDAGEVVERITAGSPLPGLEVFTGERMTVALWRMPEGVVSSAPLVRPGGLTVAGGGSVSQIDGERFGYAVYPADVEGLVVPQEVLDVYLAGEDEVVALSGTSVETETLRAGRTEVLVWADAARGVWGSSSEEVHLFPMGPPAAVPAGWEAATDDARTAFSILPQGADLWNVQLADGDVDSAVLGGRAVVLVEERGDDRADVSFRFESTQHELRAWSDDIRTLQVGPELALQEGTRTPGTVELVPDDGGDPLLTVGPDELDRGLVTTSADGRPVVVAAGWDTGGDVIVSARVELDDGSGPRWVTPVDVAQTALADGRPVTLLAVDLSGDDQVVAVGRQVGGDVDRWEVERWDPPVRAAGVEWRQVDGAPVPFVDGAALPRLDDGATDGVRHYADGSGSARGYVVLPGQAAGATFVPLLEGDGELLTAPEMVHQVDEVEVGDGTDTVLTVVGGLDDEGGSTLAGVAAQRASEGAANTWTVVGDASSAHVVVDPGLVVSIGAEQGVWVVYPTGSVDPSQLQAGRIGQDLALLRTAPGTDSTLVAVSPEGAPAPRVGVDDGQVEPPATHPVPQLDLVVRVWTLTGP